MSGSTFRSGFPAPSLTIPRQYSELNNTYRPRTIIMDGGGNDALFFCSGRDRPLCRSTIRSTGERFRALVQEMRADGVENIFYVGIYQVREDGIAGAVAAAVDPGMDYFRDLCDELGVIFIDTRDAFEGRPSLIGSDGLHPTPAGSQVLSDLVYQALVDEGVL